MSSAWRIAARLASVSAAPGVPGIGPTAAVSRSKIGALDLEAARGVGQPLALPARAIARRDGDQSREMAVKGAQQMDGVGEVGAAARTVLVEQAGKVRIGFRSVGGDALDLRPRDRVGLLVKGTIERHPHPFRSANRQLLPMV